MHARLVCMGLSVTLLQKERGGNVNMLLLCCHLLAAPDQGDSREARKFPEKHITSALCPTSFSLIFLGESG